MSDIVERLRTMFLPSEYFEELCDVRNAKAEILRLRAKNEKLQWELDKALDTLVVHDAVCAENEKLRAAVTEITEENRLVGLQMDRMADEIEKLRAELKDNISFIRKQADEIAELRKAAALKETGDE